MLIPNKAAISFNAATPNGKREHVETESNTVNTEVLSYSVLKEIYCDKAVLCVCEKANICVIVTNDSNAKLSCGYFAVPRPIGAEFVRGSVVVNGIAQPDLDPITGFALPDLNPDEAVGIEYALTACEPNTIVPHSATLHYTVYDGEKGNIEYSENTDTVLLNIIDRANNSCKQRCVYDCDRDCYCYRCRCRRDCCLCCRHCSDRLR